MSALDATATTAEQTISPFEATDAGDRSTWFKGAVIYELMVRSFNDTNGDGIGDLRGVIEKLDYLQWLGVTCLWLPPIFPSPLRDGGYDVADLTDIAADIGDLDDFGCLLEEAHARGIKVVIDFVMNHTSDQHPWFQASQADPEGSFGDFYVWRDHDTGYAEAPVIFPDSETSNWAWSPVRRQFYWHRFYAHQPDLNFDNPTVRDQIVAALFFWLDLGVDGFRLDAVPYLFEEEGTSCAHLDRTHEFLRDLRALIDSRYPHTMLLAEANGWPTEVAAYFGDDDECHMAFHFPVMPRIFLAARRESRTPITDVLAATPPIPEHAQWAIFLRNHDELTLEAVTDQDRDYMWSVYAEDPRMKSNLGIRRRLAPLVDNNLNQIELFTALLLSLPGTPVLYYGDEIGMGDNIWLGDRDGVRTPMQWTGDRNGGFSVANPGRLVLPPVQDSVFGYQRVNVEAEMANKSSLLRWTQRLLAERNNYRAFGWGSYRELGGSNPAVLAFARQLHDQTIMCVNNLSSRAQATKLQLPEFDGCEPIELLGHETFPRIGAMPYLLTLPGHGFYWFRLTKSSPTDMLNSTTDRPARIAGEGNESWQR
ncbi:maltose alpha-D-glucosyltransferase [Phytoactinopolyspora alkaliphila]|uniref:maltose alpha-D-glucosyltransferase n=1 Tax=Phytoactinopolyspora alkaliphila TaxID=1783498 RepID=A0A6N9YI04_9ACTN|nr:maltose alpha-D-glucosyltransferase [Phytoactinopolyspora alkaliphila]NED94633.1 maltose alpha-D-glucosyltransferase [Phytoactinopolyspora alkaliphila]